MSREATDLVLGLADDTQAEYAAAAHKTTPAADVEGASASGAQTPAAGLVAGPPTTAPQPQENPTWSPVDGSTGDLLDLLAMAPAIPSEADEWEHFQKVLAKVAAENDGVIDQNRTRPLLRGEIAPRRVGPFFHRASARGLIRAEGWTTSDDRDGKNSGRPCRSYRYLGT